MNPVTERGIYLINNEDYSLLKKFVKSRRDKESLEFNGFDKAVYDTAIRNQDAKALNILLENNEEDYDKVVTSKYFNSEVFRCLIINNFFISNKFLKALIVHGRNELLKNYIGYAIIFRKENCFNVVPLSCDKVVSFHKGLYKAALNTNNVPALQILLESSVNDFAKITSQSDFNPGKIKYLMEHDFVMSSDFVYHIIRHFNMLGEFAASVTSLNHILPYINFNTTVILRLLHCGKHQIPMSKEKLKATVDREEKKLRDALNRAVKACDLDGKKFKTEPVVRCLIEHGASITPNNIKIITNACESRENDSYLQYLIDHCDDINKKCIPIDKTALMLVCETQNESLTRYLVEHGADVNVGRSDGETPLMMVCRNGHASLTKLLIRHGADVNARNQEGETPLTIAYRKRNFFIMEWLMEHGAHLTNIDHPSDGSETPLTVACIDGQVSLAKSLIAHGVNVDERNREGETPLMIAWKFRNESLINMLIAHGADTQQIKYGVYSPTEINVTRLCEKINDTSVLDEILKNKNVSVNKYDEYGIAPLSMACYLNKKALVHGLIQHGADPNMKNKFGETALMISCRHGNPSLVEYLIQQGADVNIQNKDGETALMMACRSRNARLIKILIKHGGDVNHQNKDDTTPLLIACMYGLKPVIKYLIKHGANINLKNHRGETPLSLAYRNKNRSMVVYLIDHGADINVNDHLGKDFLENEYRSILKYLAGPSPNLF